MPREAQAARLAIGGNMPPADTFGLVKSEVDDLYQEAKHWLDGEEVSDAKTAEAIATLLNMLRDAGKKADEEFTKEKAPHLAAGRVVDDKWRPIKMMVKTAADACKKALGVWQVKVDAAQRAH